MDVVLEEKKAHSKLMCICPFVTVRASDLRKWMRDTQLFSIVKSIPTSKFFLSIVRNALTVSALPFFMSGGLLV
jgi:hypothetical protein